MNYIPTVQLVYRFIENFVYNQGGGRMPSCITELTCVLRNNKEDPAISEFDSLKLVDIGVQ